MSTLQISRIQIRRGLYQDLPILHEGELGYATDRKRLFIGNAKDTFTGDGNTTSFTLTAKIARPQHIQVYVNDTRKTPAVDYSVSGTTLTFLGTAPAISATIEVGYNTELEIHNTELVVDEFQLAASQTDQPTGFFFNKNLFNTAIIDYSLKDSSGNLAVGHLRMITDGTTVTVLDSFTETAALGITFSGAISGDNVILRYSNTSSATAKFYYNVKLWNTT